MNILTMEDGFQWLSLNLEQALIMYHNSTAELYKLYDDESETLIESFCDFEIIEWFDKGGKVVIEYKATKTETGKISANFGPTRTAGSTGLIAKGQTAEQILKGR